MRRGAAKCQRPVPVLEPASVADIPDSKAKVSTVGAVDTLADDREGMGLALEPSNRDRGPVESSASRLSGSGDCPPPCGGLLTGPEVPARLEDRFILNHVRAGFQSWGYRVASDRCGERQSASSGLLAAPTPPGVGTEAQRAQAGDGQGARFGNGGGGDGHRAQQDIAAPEPWSL